MHKYQIELVTMEDIRKFVEVVSRLDGEILLTDGNRLCVNAKSVLGAIATVEWSSLWCVSGKEIGEHIAWCCTERENRYE